MRVNIELSDRTAVLNVLLGIPAVIVLLFLAGARGSELISLILGAYGTALAAATILLGGRWLARASAPFRYRLGFLIGRYAGRELLAIVAGLRQFIAGLVKLSFAIAIVGGAGWVVMRYALPLWDIPLGSIKLRELIAGAASLCLYVMAVWLAINIYK